MRGCMIAWHHEITTREGNAVQRSERSGDGGAPGGPTRPQIPDSCMGQVVGMYFEICKADIEAGMYSIVDLSGLQYTVQQQPPAAGRRGIASHFLPSTPRMQCRLPALRH